MTQHLHANPHALRDALRELPETAPPDDVWAQIERRTSGERRRRAGHWWSSAAAGTLLAVAAGLWTLGRAPATAPVNDIASLMTQSQQLERRVARHGTAEDAEWDASRRALIYRITDLDRELAPLSIDPSRNPARAETLWRQRVALMQSLAELDRVDAPHRTLAL